MKRITTELPLPPDILARLVHLASEYPVAMVLSSNPGRGLPNDPYSRYDLLAGLGIAAEARGGNQAFKDLQRLVDEKQDWIFTAFPYDLKNQVERLQSANYD